MTSPAGQTNLRCPSCRYDLSGTPDEQCPECGGRFNRDLLASGWYQRPPDPWPRNWALVGSVAAGMVGSGYSLPTPTIGEWVWFALTWLLAGLWVVLRWRSVVTDRPWLPMWLWLVAAVTQESSNFPGAQEVVASYISVALAAIATLVVFWRAPRAGLRGLLYGASVLSWIIAVVFGVGGIISGLGANEGGRYHYFWIEMPAGGTNDVIPAIVAAVHGILGWGLWGLGTAVYGKRA